MLRKWSIVAVAVSAVLAAASGLSFADEDSPIHKVMEGVSSKSNAIKKAFRTPVAYKKSQKDIVKHSEELIELGKKARELKETSDKAKKPFAEWQKLCDDFVKETTDYKAVVAKADTDQPTAKKAWGKVNTTCTACHEVFRVEDEK
jgi:cytochrome c556